MSFVTFITPSKGRATLAHTIMSMYEQTNNDWNSVICFDNVELTIKSNTKIQAIKTPKKLGVGVNSAGDVRNYAIDYIKTTSLLVEWLGLVDDGDILAPTYVNSLKYLSNLYPNIDLIVFKMLLLDTERIIPRDINLPLVDLENDIGISFAFKPKIFDKVRFFPSSGEDYQFLIKAVDEGFNMLKSNLLEYIVAPLGVATDRR